MEDYSLPAVFLTPLISFLFGESIGLSGFLVIMISAFMLNLYGTPNMNKFKAETIRDTLEGLAYISRTICYLLMGISLPLHLQSPDSLTNSHRGKAALVASITLILVLGFFISVGVMLAFVKLFPQSGRAGGMLTNKNIATLVVNACSSKGIINYVLAL